MTNTRQLGPLAHATPEQAAHLIKAGVEAGTALLRKQVAELGHENLALRAELESMRAELRALQAKAAGGAALLPRR